MNSLNMSADANEHVVYAAERARLLFGCYRSGDAIDPRTYVAAVTVVLAEFDRSVIDRVTDPVRGIARKLKFMPSIAELFDECGRIASVIDGERIIAEREAQGFQWLESAKDGRLGFYNAQGDKYRPVLVSALRSQ